MRNARAAKLAATARRRLRLATSVLCGALLVALTFVTVADVVGRYLLAAPLPGAAEYTEILLMAIIFTGLPAVCLDDGHITVDLFTGHLRGRWARAQLAMARFAVSVALAVIAWQLWVHAEQLASWNEVTIYLRAPLAPFAKGAAVICGVCSVIALVMAALRLPQGAGEGGA